MILAIESSCDDTSISVMEIETKKLIFHKKISQEVEHSKYGGVVPELASRLHAEALPKILTECKSYFDNLKAVAITNAPGLSVTLQEGVMVAKALSISLNLPIIAVNHLIGHIYSLFIEKEEIKPMMVLLVSGGHTKLLNFNGIDNICEIATTLDDSFGESFDKVAKMLGLGYPGGPVIENLAKKGEIVVDLPLPLKNSPDIKFSYSGIKNAVRLAIESGNYKNEDIAASFQKKAIEHLVFMSKRAIKKYRPKNFAIVGGASANLVLRSEFEKLSEEFNFNLYYPDMKFTSDNAAMIARAGIELYNKKRFINYKDLKVMPRVEFKKC
ncbi:tRNA (adenosine(37)-N6)-threonylcarbamoyltransferase complex transferase subunit TsaD [Caminibacter mediatlanticus TB-2]|uniref:tRNA N6-adenosine threonylcarbamoyltransferase n=1 Tax=Caminibacter mediatlanticus TB-2 TaxID=391592 RepID=A0AAI9AG26_9BACT|nr:tRNA (adenosine(37)-N6)-threonylcarbamoyltransferase complex transferase subunit TsaD [Caminibacter mediatlanticus]EDM22966.1 O-sialoglycoprotein endopeptidase [Caminibacter mediatlanticus TB-2]QCT95298.1 tRNA (adenosine(37)-N6)-threonylcarbamoyltransferase complex transferase subunit TsaD [Caminibacter mediatlanticus TB-2]